jgi:hypothetical protein
MRLRTVCGAIIILGFNNGALAQQQPAQQQAAPFQSNVPTLIVPQQPPAKQLDSSGQFRDPALPNSRAPKKLDTFGDKVTRCIHGAGAAGVPAEQIGEFSRQCAHAQ